MDITDHHLLLLGVILAAIVIAIAVIMGRRIEASIGSVHFELQPNSGKSFRDVVDARFDRIEVRIERVEAQIESIE